MAVFSEDMDNSTLTRATVTLMRKGATTPVVAAVLYDADSRRVILDPKSNLLRGASYRATIEGGVDGAKDLSGNALEVSKVWRFTINP